MQTQSTGLLAETYSAHLACQQTLSDNYHQLHGRYVTCVPRTIPLSVEPQDRTGGCLVRMSSCLPRSTFHFRLLDVPSLNSVSAGRGSGCIKSGAGLISFLVVNSVTLIHSADGSR